MRKVGFIILFSYFTLFAQASQHIIHTQRDGSSPTAFIVVGVAVLLLIVIVLFRRQKRKFND